jgi:hypothetical protein
MAAGVTDDAPRPYTRGWRAPWRRGWGSFADGHTRLSKLARRIEREIQADYVLTSPLDRRRAREAARLMALSEQTLATVGVDPKSSRRLATALSKTAEGKLARLAPRTGTTGNGHGTPPVSVRQFGSPT